MYQMRNINGYILLSLSLSPLLIVNIWHNYLLFKNCNLSKKFNSISRHAADNNKYLKTHRLMHIFGSFAMILFAIGFLIPNDYVLPGLLLILGAVFDSLEVLTLNKKSSSVITKVNSHTLTAWAMALSYLLYLCILIPIAGLSSSLILAIWLSLAILLLISAISRFRNFATTQHIYFCFIATLIAIAHLKLVF